MVGEKKLPARKPTSGGAIEAAQLAALLDKLINPANQSSRPVFFRDDPLRLDWRSPASGGAA